MKDERKHEVRCDQPQHYEAGQQVEEVHGWLQHDQYKGASDYAGQVPKQEEYQVLVYNASIILPEVGIEEGFLAVVAAAKLPSQKSLFLSLLLVLSPQPTCNLTQTLN